MKEVRITDQMLHDASALLWQEIVAEEEANLEPHEPSPEFRERMEALLQENKTQENKPQKAKVHRFRRRAWMTVAMIIIALFTWLAFDTKARASVAEWFESVIEGVFHYSFSGSAVDGTFPTYRLGWVPEGGKIRREKEIEGREYSIFIDYENDGVLSLTYGKFDEGTVFGVDPLGHEMTKTMITVRGQEIEEYYTPYWNDYNYVWMNESKDIYFTIWSTFDHDTNIRIIKDILKGK